MRLSVAMAVFLPAVLNAAAIPKQVNSNPGWLHDPAVKEATMRRLLLNKKRAKRYLSKYSLLEKPFEINVVVSYMYLFLFKTQGSVEL